MNAKKQHAGSRLLLLPLLSYNLLIAQASAGDSVESYLEMELDDLLSMEVTSVSKKRQRLTEAASAVFVITQDDIRRSGVTSIPEALRMAPGLQVAKIDSNKWAISSRGFNAQFANKLLVLIDGRSVYTPSFSGVYWEIQDRLLEDIDRIEVIRGPGATLWGANAVNGVINIITKQASETRGGLLVAGGGNEEKGFAGLRYGAALGEQTHGRLYLKYNDRDSSFAPLSDKEAGDDWQALRAGFRVDGAWPEADQWTLQGDIYDTDANQIVAGTFLDPFDPANNPPDPASPYRVRNLPDSNDSSGWNLLGRWEHRLSEKASTTLQLYYDRNKREEATLGQTHDTLDIDFQHRFSPLQRHEIVWGLGYRRIEDKFDNTFDISLLPDKQTTDIISAFAQDEIELIADTLRLTLGSKFEYNDYTGNEIQPSVRLLWLPQEGHSLWSSISRAVRTPSRVDEGSAITVGVIPPLPPLALPGTPPVIVKTEGNDDVESEELTAFELGYRLQPAEGLSLDLALFYNRYKNLRSFENTGFLDLINPADPLGPPMRLSTGVLIDSKMKASSRGLELAAEWLPREWWRLQANYSYLDLSADAESGSNDAVTAAVVEGSSPKHQLSLRSAMDLSNAWSLDLWAYYVDELSASSLSNPLVIQDYISLNARLAWRPGEGLELSLVGHNLLDDRHPEFVGENFVTPTEVERSIYGQVRLEF